MAEHAGFHLGLEVTMTRRTWQVAIWHVGSGCAGAHDPEDAVHYVAQVMARSPRLSAYMVQ